MNLLQESLDRLLHEAPYHALAELIRSKLEAQGVRLSDREVERLVSHLVKLDGETFRLRSWRWWDKKTLSISITDEEIAELIGRFEGFAAGGLAEVIQYLSDELAQDILRTLHKTWRREARRERRTQSGFEARLVKLWGIAIDRLVMSLAVSRKLGDAASHYLRQVEDAPEILAGVLIRLHARACQVTEEVVCLLRSGLADGAMARWRTLHEIASVAFVLARHGESLAERYVAHDAIESFRAAADYRVCHERLGYEPMSDDEYVAIKSNRDDVLARYGADFGSQYGWAAAVLGKKQPSLRDIQEAAGIDHLRAHYRMASHNVHANPKGVFFKLGLLDECDVLLAGRSNAGLADPGHSCAISLMHVTVALCTVRPNLDVIVGLKILQVLVDEVGELFYEAHNTLAHDAG